MSGYLTTGAGLYLADYLTGGLNEPATAQPNLKVQAAPTSKHAYRIAPWNGDDFTIGHKLRNHEIPVLPKHIENEVDFVIVGGGMAGLASAYYLRDHNFLLLEQYDALGGQSRGGSYHGLSFSYGAAYFNDVEGLIGDLLSELNLKPAKLDAKKNSWRWENSWLAGLEGTDKLYSEIKTLTENCRPIWKRLPEGIPIPLMDSDLLKLDATPFRDYMKSHSPAFIALVDAYLKSSLCGGVNNVSALSAISLLEDLTEASYVLPGGNPTLARALEQKVAGKRCARGFVWSIEVGENKSTVVYADKDGVLHRVACRHVIVTAPPLVAGRILANIGDQIKAGLLSFKYGSYLVANILMPKKIFSGAYDNWVTPPFTFADISIAETPYIQQRSYKPEMGSVLTIYQPYLPSSEGRSVLLEGNRERFATSIVDQLTKLIGPIEKDIETVVLTRWGHAMAVNTPGFFAKISKFNRTANSGYTFAHCSTQGIPCAEGAVAAARLAADRALGKPPAGKHR